MSGISEKKSSGVEKKRQECWRRKARARSWRENGRGLRHGDEFVSQTAENVTIQDARTAPSSTPATAHVFSVYSHSGLNMNDMANTEKPTLSKSEQAGRNALLSDINKGKKLKKTVTNDRSAPILDKPKGAGGGGGGGSGSFGGGGPPGLGGLFQAGMPKLRSTANRESDSGGSRPPILPPGGRPTSAKPFSPPSGPGRFPVPSPGHRSGPPEPQRNRMPPPRPDVGAKPDNIPPPVPNTPRPVQSSLHNRGSTLVPGAPRQPSPGPTPPPLPGNRGAAFGGGSTRQTPSGSSSPFSNRPPLPPTPSRALDDKPPPPPPPVGSRPSIHREAVPPPPPQNSKPPVPSTPRPSPSAQAPPPPPSRPGPPPVPPGSGGGGGGDEIPRLPQRNLSLSSSSSSSSSAPPLPSPGRSGPLPPPPSERPPPPVRDPPGRSGPLPPPPPMNRNGSTSRALPATPQLPSRSGTDSPRSGPRPPLPPDRPGTGVPPPPPPSTSIRNGFQDSSCEGEVWSRLLGNVQAIVGQQLNGRCSRILKRTIFVANLIPTFLNSSWWMSGKADSSSIRFLICHLQSHMYQQPKVIPVNWQEMKAGVDATEEKGVPHPFLLSRGDPCLLFSTQAQELLLLLLSKSHTLLLLSSLVPFMMAIGKKGGDVGMHVCRVCMQ
ncbi:hypothetical protein DBR06_SOUSAS5510071 [Sousa chinensis]|nr:hypothetical protein DBR06_SOUSAS5510071 [Sousa chinensis]